MTARLRTTVARFLRALLATSVVAACACSSDGGVGGTGISATIDGNVSGFGEAALQLGGDTEDRSLAGIRVRARHSGDAETVTDTTGDFRLEGGFSGNVRLDFIEPNKMVSTLDVQVPAGSTVTLVDVRLRLAGPQAQMRALPDRVVLDRFEAFLDEDAGCSGSDEILTVRDQSGTVFEVLLTDSTKLESDQDPDTTPPCEDLSAGSRIRVLGNGDAGGGDIVVASRIRILRSGRPPGDKLGDR